MLTVTNVNIHIVSEKSIMLPRSVFVGSKSNLHSHSQETSSSEALLLISQSGNP